MTIRTRALAGPLLGALVALVAVIGPATPAAAHPFGPPATARISADGTRVSIAWLAAEDDWVALGQSLGAFEDPASGKVDGALTGEKKLQRSPAVRDYLLKRITVSQSGQPCTGRLDTLERLVKQGARLDFECPQPVTDLDVTVSALTDLNTAYRTALTADVPMTPPEALFTATEGSHRVRLGTGEGGSGRPAAVGTVAAGTGIAAVAILAGVWVNRRRRTRRKPA
ncbi:hypothetical protein OG792_21450 [Micromonospora sp. NBC_01699]|uniref:hypothetical protein n=1 Tax=Micromonospora sp. NBC_01699 TaxID=2975984 RepID=UPI002E2E47D2|nr:hypothetical protein [Micromonospora sp. NBC_01699]